MNPYLLGASLYVPATRDQLWTVGKGLRSVIFCTEDAVAERDVHTAIAHLREALPLLPSGRTQYYVRARNPEVLARLLELPGIERLSGFVLPKTTRRSLPNYLDVLGGDSTFALMPTIETAEAFHADEMHDLRTLLTASAIAPRILALRVGGNDLMRTLGIRRPQGGTLYDTALGALLAPIVATFRPAGFALTATVFDGFNHAGTLRAEVERDLAFGFIAKGAIHPAQVPIIEAAYAVIPAELDMARAILRDDAPAVFGMHDTMCELTTHSPWAHSIVAREREYGIRGE